MTQIKRIVASEVVPIWEYLQEKFIKFKCKGEDDADIKLKYLKSLFLLGDYIYKNKLLKGKPTGEIEIFKPDTIINLVNFHVQLLIISQGKRLFESPEWVTPQIDLLISDPSLKHFHRSIKGLEKTKKNFLEYLILRSIMENYEFLCPIRRDDYPLEIEPYFQAFLDTNFIQQERKDCVLKSQGSVENIKSVFLPALKMIVEFFENMDNLESDERSSRQVQKFQVLISFCILNFIITYHPWMIVHVFPDFTRVLMSKIRFMVSLLSQDKNRSQLKLSKKELMLIAEIYEQKDFVVKWIKVVCPLFLDKK
ncbi:hypothetical protein PGT21_015840 [Puccinia graminis f. sp. tritici]|uniref:Uncharacterized protein n=1 Tax=Puccinia graminis f. sp. tritici TaxID=56615 RepID=A0A5B0LLN0_PUCGR|nr:hypothetical protein PGT21_015840 [Puccinia graminis f. sp. tritici]